MWVCLRDCLSCNLYPRVSGLRIFVRSSPVRRSNHWRNRPGIPSSRYWKIGGLKRIHEDTNHMLPIKDFPPPAAPPRQYELWKLLQPNYCPHCGGEIEQILVGYDPQRNPQYKPQCKQCRSQNLPQFILSWWRFELDMQVFRRFEPVDRHPLYDLNGYIGFRLKNGI